MINYELYILISIVAFVYTNLLTEPEMIFNRLYNLLDRKLPRWIFKIVIHCEKCFSGQAALWIYVIFNYQHYDLMIHIFSVAFTIFCTAVIKNLYQLINR